MFILSVAHIYYMRVTVDLSRDEYNEFVKARGNKTNREALLTGVELDAAPRRIGRPSLDKIIKSLEKTASKKRESDSAAVQARLAREAAESDARKKLDELNEKYMAKLRGE